MEYEEDIIEYDEQEDEQLEYTDDDSEVVEDDEGEVVEDVTPTDIPVEKTVTIMNRSGKGRPVKGRLGKLVGKQAETKMVAYKTKDRLLQMINENMEDFSTTLSILKQEDPRSYAAIMTQMMKYVAPTLASVTAEVNAEARITIEDTLKSLSEIK